MCGQAFFMYKKREDGSFESSSLGKKAAATYSHTWYGTTIGTGELNFSVRDGKRWILTVITAAI